MALILTAAQETRLSEVNNWMVALGLSSRECWALDQTIRELMEDAAAERERRLAALAGLGKVGQD